MGLGGVGGTREKECTRAYLLKQGKGMSQMRASGNVVLKQHFIFSFAAELLTLRDKT